MSRQQQQQQQTSGSNTQKVEIYIVRHGYSIPNRATDTNLQLHRRKQQNQKSQPNKFLGNIFKIPNYTNISENLSDAISTTSKTFEADPSLTRTGIYQSQLAAQHIVNPDLVFTSVLCRAQQTSIFMFPSQDNIIVAPHLKEENNPFDRKVARLFPTDNIPFKDIITQYEKRHNILSEAQLDKLRYTSDVLDSDTHPCKYNDREMTRNGDIRTFINNFLTPFLSEKKNVFTKSSPLRVAIVCHGGIIRKFLNLTKENKIFNNAIFKLETHVFSKLQQSHDYPIDMQKDVQFIFEGFPPFKETCETNHNLVEADTTYAPTIFKINNYNYAPRYYTYKEIKTILSNASSGEQGTKSIGSRIRDFIDFYKRIQSGEPVNGANDFQRRIINIITKLVNKHKSQNLSEQSIKQLLLNDEQIKNEVYSINDTLRNVINARNLQYYMGSQIDLVNYVNYALHGRPLTNQNILEILMTKGFLQTDTQLKGRSVPRDTRSRTQTGGGGRQQTKGGKPTQQQTGGGAIPPKGGKQTQQQTGGGSDDWVQVRR